MSLEACEVMLQRVHLHSKSNNCKKDKTEVALEISHLVQNGQAVIQQLGDVPGMV